MKTKKEIEAAILNAQQKLEKYEPNSIMGVHWSSKLAGLKRELEKLK